MLVSSHIASLVFPVLFSLCAHTEWCANRTRDSQERHWKKKNPAEMWKCPGSKKEKASIKTCRAVRKWQRGGVQGWSCQSQAYIKVFLTVAEHQFCSRASAQARQREAWWAAAPGTRCKATFPSGPDTWAADIQARHCLKLRLLSIDMVLKTGLHDSHNLITHEENTQAEVLLLKCKASTCPCFCTVSTMLRCCSGGRGNADCRRAWGLLKGLE